MSTGSTIWFLASIVFLVFFALASGAAERALRRTPGSPKYLKRCRLLIGVGALFVIVEACWFYPIAQAHKDNWGIAVFVWLCVNGIMAFMVGGKVIGLFKHVKAARK